MSKRTRTQDDEFTVRMFDCDALRDAREAAGLSQPALGEAVGRNDKSIRSYEMGYISPPVDVLVDIANYLGVDIAEFFPINEKASARARNMFGGKSSPSYRGNGHGGRRSG